MHLYKYDMVPQDTNSAWSMLRRTRSLFITGGACWRWTTMLPRSNAVAVSLDLSVVIWWCCRSCADSVLVFISEDVVFVKR